MPSSTMAYHHEAPAAVPVRPRPQAAPTHTAAAPDAPLGWCQDYDDFKVRVILNNIADGYYEVDLAGNLTCFNRSMIRILGFPPEALMGMNNRAFMDAANAARVYQVFNRVYRTGESARALDWELISANGAQRIVETSVNLKRDENGAPCGFMGIARDITERKRAEKALRQQKHKLQEEIRRRKAAYNALRVLMQQREEERRELMEDFLSNIKSLLRPQLEHLQRGRLDCETRERLALVEASLKKLASPFARSLTSAHYSLTPMELKIADFVRHGRRTKTIAHLLGLAPKTVETHRNNIRRKLGINRTKTNMRTFLLGLE